MIELRLLGSLDLRGPDGTALQSVLAQPKRTALLAYLAVRGGFVRRDALLPLLWPEADTEQARASLRRALYFLRQSLGEGVIVSRGNEEVGIAAARLRCDAAEFRGALECGAAACALELYQGDLLPGFFTSGAPEFEAWLDAERAQLRVQACGAAWTLAAETELAGDADRAEQLARRALVLSQEDERALGKLMELLHRLGDAAGAIGAYEEFAQRLARDYEIDPSPEMQARVAALRTQVRTRALSTPTAPLPPLPPPAPPEERGAKSEERGTSADVFPLSQHGAAMRAPDSRERGSGGEGLPGGEGPARKPRAGVLSAVVSRRRRVVLLLLLTVTVAGLGMLGRLDSRPATPPSARVIAVLPFSYHGSGEYAYLAEGIVRMLSTNLNGVAELRSVDPRALLNAVDQIEAGALEARHGSALAARFGAGVFVLGHIMEAGGRLRITAVVYDQSRASPTGPVEEVTVEGEAAQLFGLVDELTARLLASRSAAPQERLIRLAALTTHSLPALKAYVEGEREYRAGRFAAALEAFHHAVETDSSFALAHYRLSGAAHWGGQQETADSAQHRAIRHGHRLSRRDRLLVEAWPLYRGSGPIEAQRLYRAVLLEHPDDVEAWFQLGEVQFHWGPSLGRPVSEAREAFERVLAFEPANVGALIHLTRIAADEGRVAEMDSLVSRILALEPESGVALQMRALRAYTFGDRAAQERILMELGSADHNLLNAVVVTVATHSSAFHGAAEMARLLTTPRWIARRRAQLGHLRLAQLELARGRWSAARPELLTAESLWPYRATEIRAAYATFPFLRLPAGEIEALQREIAHLAFESPLPDDRRHPNRRRLIHGPHHLYLLGLLSTRRLDPPAALDFALQLDRHGGTAQDSAFSRDFAGSIRAHVAWTGGHAAEALQHLGEPRLLQSETLPELINYPKADERWLRAELLRTLGREEEALRIYASFPDPQGYDLHYLAPAHLRRAEIHERRGERQQAVAHYRRFLDLWQDADPELQPLVRQARERLERR